MLADGEGVIAGEQTKADPYRALRGGGTFGVITEARVRPWEVGPPLTGRLIFPLAKGPLPKTGDGLTIDVARGSGPEGSTLLVITPRAGCMQIPALRISNVWAGRS